MNKDRYHRNRKRVYEIYGKSRKDRSKNAHHIVFRSDAKEGGPMEGYDVNAKGNLIPMNKKTHERLHKKADRQKLRAKRRRRNK